MSTICFTIVVIGMLIFTLYSNFKLYKLVYHHQLDKLFDNENMQEINELLSLFDEKTQRKIQTTLWSISFVIVWIIVMSIWFLSRHQVTPIPHLATTYLLVWVLVTIFDIFAWPDAFRPNVKLTKPNLIISVTGDIAEYALLLSMSILALLSLK